MNWSAAEAELGEQRPADLAGVALGDVLGGRHRRALVGVERRGLGGLGRPRCRAGRSGTTCGCRRSARSAARQPAASVAGRTRSRRRPGRRRRRATAAGVEDARRRRSCRWWPRRGRPSPRRRERSRGARARGLGAASVLGARASGASTQGKLTGSTTGDIKRHSGRDRSRSTGGGADVRSRKGLDHHAGCASEAQTFDRSRDVDCCVTRCPMRHIRPQPAPIDTDVTGWSGPIRNPSRPLPTA